MCAVAGVGRANPGDNITTAVADYVPPAVTLVRANGEQVPFASLVDGAHPVVLEFFFTSCTTICGIQTATFARAQSGFGANAVLVSVSIDPEYDTPARLRDYAGNFNPGGNWYMLTGRRSDIVRILTAFDARPFGDNKMLHRPYVFIRPAKGHQWVRVEGLTSSQRLVSEFRAAVAHPPPASSTMSSIRESLNRFIGG